MRNLDELVILEVAEGIAGPCCGLQFADLGAKVIKVEPPHGDRSREWGPPMIGADAAVFVHLNRGKRSVVLDLNRPEAADQFLKLLPDADAVIVHLDPEDRRQCSINWRDLPRDFPHLIVCEIVDIGQSGPLNERTGSELVVQAMSGFTRYVGMPGGEPYRVGFEIAGMATAMHAFQGVMAALLNRARTGEGQYLQVCALRSLLSMKSILMAAQDEPDRWEGFHLQGPRWARDIGWITKDGQVTFDFRKTQKEQWIKFCAAIGLDDLPDDPDYQDWHSTIYIGDRRHTHGKVYEPAFAAMTCDEASALINGLEGISVKFQDYLEVLNHPQVQLLKPTIEVHDSSGGRMRQLGSPFQLTGLPPWETVQPAPALGAHSDEVLG